MATTTTTASMATATAVSASQPLALRELAHACGADVSWVVQLVEVGVVQTAEPAAEPERWRFESTALQRALEVRRLERDFGTNLDAAALVIDLEYEVRRLKSVLRAHGLDREI